MPIDETAKEFLESCGGRLPRLPLKTRGDGNCLFNAISLVLFGNEEAATELRVRTCLELVENQGWYENSYESSRIMWTSTMPKDKKFKRWNPNHFVPLVLKEQLNLKKDHCETLHKIKTKKVYHDLDSISNVQPLLTTFIEEDFPNLFSDESDDSQIRSMTVADESTAFYLQINLP